MAADSPQIEAFKRWLPGELEYSVAKADYPEKIRRAGLSIDDGQSIYHFLGQMWFTYQFMMSGGNHHTETDVKSAQSQLAKFAAGLYDKAALGRWMLLDNLPATPEVFQDTAQIAGETMAKRHRWRFITTDLAEVINKSFADTPFAEGVLKISEDITTASITTNQTERIKVVTDFSDLAEEMGGLAVRCYDLYAGEFLDPSEYELPVSELKDPVSH